MKMKLLMQQPEISEVRDYSVIMNLWNQFFRMRMMIRHPELWAVLRLSLWWEGFLASWFFVLPTIHFYFSLRADCRSGTVFRSFIYSFSLGLKDTFLSKPFPKKVSASSPLSSDPHYRGLLTTDDKMMREILEKWGGKWVILIIF